jgi:hypothetical protein
MLDFHHYKKNGMTLLLLQLCVHTAVLEYYYSCTVVLYRTAVDSRSTRVQQAVVLLMYTKKYGRTYSCMHKLRPYLGTRVRHA